MASPTPARGDSIAAPIRLPHILATWAFLPAIVWSMAFSVVVLLVKELWETPESEDINQLIQIIFVVTPTVWIIVTWLLVVLRRKTLRRVQRDRNRFATQVIRHLVAGGVEPPPFSLYLRPFFTDKQLIDSDGVFSAVHLTDPLTMAELGQRRDCERGAANALQAHAPLIAIGTPGDALGAGRAQVADEAWFSVIQLLARHATRLIVVPLAQPSTLQEIRFVAEQPDLLEKTVFVRPANRWRLRFLFRNEPGKTLGEIWERTRELLTDLLPGFPRFAGGARMFVFQENGEPRYYYGNSFCSIQSATGVRALLVQGKIVSLGLLPFVAWLPLVALLDLHPDSSYFGPNSRLRPLAELVFSYTLVVSAFLFLKTMDRPYRAWISTFLLSLGFILMQVLAMTFQICKMEENIGGLVDWYYSLPQLAHQLLPTPCGRIHILLMSVAKAAVWGAAIGAFWSYVYQRRVLLRTTAIAASGAALAVTIYSLIEQDITGTGIVGELAVTVINGALSGGVMAIGFMIGHGRRTRTLLASFVVGSTIAGAANFAVSRLTDMAWNADSFAIRDFLSESVDLLSGLIRGLAMLVFPIALMGLDGTFKARRWAAPLRDGGSRSPAS